MATSRSETTLQPVPAIAGAIVPGAGYIVFGDVRRAVLVFVGVMGLVLGGILIGGIDVIDRKQDPFWFSVQVGAGPVVVVADVIHQNQLKPNNVNTPSIGRVNEIGSLYVALAGFLNAIAVIDCLWHAPGPRRTRREDF